MSQAVRETSLETFTANRDQFDTLKELTLFELKNFYSEHDFWPTYNELQKFMIRKNDHVTWRTQIQPRLTSDLVDEHKVRRNGKRECHVSGENIETWRPLQ